MITPNYFRASPREISRGGGHFDREWAVEMQVNDQWFEFVEGPNDPRQRFETEAEAYAYIEILTTRLNPENMMARVGARDKTLLYPGGPTKREHVVAIAPHDVQPGELIRVNIPSDTSNRPGFWRRLLNKLLHGR